MYDENRKVTTSAERLADAITKVRAELLIGGDGTVSRIAAIVFDPTL